MNLHDGHRERMRDRFAETGLEGFSDHNALELLLFYALPRIDTNELAHRLLDHFGSYTAIFEAEIEELKQVKGIGDNAAALIKLVPQMNRRYLELKCAGTKTISCSDDAGEYFKAKFAYEVKEIAYALLLDARSRILGCVQFGDGVVNATEIDIRKLVEAALRYKAVSVIIAHNHPQSPPFPSKEDACSTEKIKTALDTVGIELLDHVIIGDGKFQSLKRLGIM